MRVAALAAAHAQVGWRRRPTPEVPGLGTTENQQQPLATTFLCRTETSCGRQQPTLMASKFLPKMTL